MIKTKKLRIATFVASEIPFPIPKDFKEIYAPVEVALNIAEGLAKKGHEVTFFGPKGSKSKICKAVEIPIEPLYKNKILKAHHVREKEQEKIFYLFDQYIISSIFRENLENKFDIIHIHPVDRAMPFARLTKTPIVYTLHDPIYDWKAELFEMYQTKNQYFISITNAQRKPAPNINWAGTVYNGIDLKLFPFNPKPKNYILFLGRLLAKKGVHLAIKAAIETGENLLIAGDKIDAKFWEEQIKPHLKLDNVTYKGFLPYSKTHRLYQEAKTLLCPIQWEEPFGLTFIEAMACGTPVIAFARGSAPEVIRDGKTGFLVEPYDKKGNININGFIEKIKRIGEIDRKECRKWVQENFTIEKMVEDYEKIFLKLAGKTK